MPADVLTWRLEGLEDVERRLQVLAQAHERAALRALREEAEVEMTEAKRRTPVDTGALRGSGHVISDREALAVTLAFGGAAAPYAIHVHEDLEAFHKVGQAKFLESTLLESAPHMVTRVARRMRDILGL